ncbi:SMP-30/gluconolactonase/LRE family protein [Hoeflea sp.]|uniref:SMP-30/gluconolactonase/LRE family protein n=1 Tax=Hoeflea sp. TaxID=1940281 RepID=UPI003B01EFC5
MKQLLAAAAVASLTATGAMAETKILHEGALFPEGALFHEGAHFFVELVADRVVKLDGGNHVVFWDGNGCAPASVIDHDGGFVVACNGGSAIVRLDADGNELWRKGRDDSGVNMNQPNDLTHGGNGDLWFTASGAPDPAQQPQGQVFHMTAGGDVTLAAEGLSYANGLAVVPNGNTLLVADMFTSRILAYPIEGSSLGEPKVWADLASIAPNGDGALPPFPDGMEFGPDGNLYIAIWGGKKIVVLDAAGEVAKEIPTPLLGTTNLTFIDPETLLVTGVHDISGAPFAGDVIEMKLN